MIKFLINNSNSENILNHLQECNVFFVPKLDSYVNLKDYSIKLQNKAIRFECFNNNLLIGLIAAYENNEYFYITNYSVLPEYLGSRIAHRLFDFFTEHTAFKTIKLEVNQKNIRAINFYKKYNFTVIETTDKSYIMQRNYNEELHNTKDHNYVYGFDFDVMHPYILKTFIPFFSKQNVLELGSYKGDFTQHLSKHFSQITCIEASSEAAEFAKNKLSNANIICDTFENCNLNKKFDNIIITHVLEHIDDRVELLKKINRMWLSKNGKLFIVCPNANAISRQIAVKMGIMSEVTCITESEYKHGHRITYSFESLEKDILQSGLKIFFKTGIFLKSLANFQMDKVINQNIVTKEYLDGCYNLGFKYPDLCSSIFFLCGKQND